MAIVTQVLHVLDLYQGIDPATAAARAPTAAAAGATNATAGTTLSSRASVDAFLVGRPERAEFPSNGFAYTLCGIAGSTLTVTVPPGNTSFVAFGPSGAPQRQ